MVFDIHKDGSFSEGIVFHNATSYFDGNNGLADGMKVNKKGYVFATGPGGVFILSPEGEHIGTIKTGKATSNCCFNADESILYMTAHDQLMRLKLK